MNNLIKMQEEKSTPYCYKQTEVGLIPEDWDCISIGDLTDCTAGGTPNTSVKNYWGEHHPWMSSGELHLRQVYNVAERITEEGLANSSTKYIPKNSVLIGLAGQGKTRGTVAIARISLCTNQSIAAIFPNEKFSSDYLYFNLDSRYEELRSLSTGDGGRGGLNLKIIRKLRIPYPCINEQTAIANVLSDTDALITSLEKLITKKQVIKTASMQQLLTGRTRLPKFTENSDGTLKHYKHSDLGLIPEDWKISTLEKLGSFKNGINKGAQDFGHGDPFVNLMDVFGKLSINSSEHLGLIKSTDSDKKEYSLEKGDVLFIRSSVKPSGVGLTTLINENLKNTVFSGFLIRFRSNEEICNEFKEYCFSESGFRERLIASSTVSANTNINQNSLKKMTVLLPEELNEQIAIATILSDMDTELEALEQKLAKVRDIKQGMMQQLLTGRIRLALDNQP